MSPVRAPVRSMIAFVPTVVPWRNWLTWASWARASAAVTPSTKRVGTDGSLTVTVSPVATSTATRSVNVPPMSTATVYLAPLASTARDRIPALHGPTSSEGRAWRAVRSAAAVQRHPAAHARAGLLAGQHTELAVDLRRALVHDLQADVHAGRGAAERGPDPHPVVGDRQHRVAALGPQREHRRARVAVLEHVGRRLAADPRQGVRGGGLEHEVFEVQLGVHARGGQPPAHARADLVDVVVDVGVLAHRGDGHRELLGGLGDRV